MGALDDTGQIAATLAWARWFRRTVTVQDLPGPGTEAGRLVDEAAAGLAGRLFTDRPRTDRPAWFTEGRRIALLAEARRGFRTDPEYNNGKVNAKFGVAALELVRTVDLARYVESVTGVAVRAPHASTYLGYLFDGSALELHLDDERYGDITLLLCLHHRPPNEGCTGSRTVFLEGRERRFVELGEREILVFDGVFAPHGRTPVAGGEEIVLLSFGFRALRNKGGRGDDIEFPPGA
ncbi:hypothetical protein [Streptomyces sp. CC224B]|uniref:hypothetical protein n=1 Tax=Streptomyces sp. CC224B TaxID=3044571 RepID=UPI0024A93589|nr:hypothetical protein [Streptomyces sp. CC224B]